MGGLLYSDERLRSMYAGGRADATARRLSHFWATVIRLGLLPRRWVTLEVAGRRSGRPVRFPLGMAGSDGDWYLVSMLGEDCNWVRNVRAAGGQAVLQRRSATPCRLVEVPAAERAAILKRYVEEVPGARPHVPVDRGAPGAAFEAIADRYPVFRVVPAGAPRRHRRRWWLVAGLAVGVALVALGGAARRLHRWHLAGLAGIGGGPSSGPGVLRHERPGGRPHDDRHRQRDGRRGSPDAGHLHGHLRAVTVNGKTQPQFEQSLGVATDPVDTFTLTGPLSFSSDPRPGSPVTVRATGKPGPARGHPASHVHDPSLGQATPMVRRMERKSPLPFFVLALALGVPFWLISGLTGVQLLPGLPLAGLMFVCPGGAALIMVGRESGTAGMARLLRRSFDLDRIAAKAWYLPVLLLMPAVNVLSFAVQRLTGTTVPAPQIAVLAALVLSVGFFIGALGEELGWSGYAIDPMQARWGALGASLLLGLFWAVYHYIGLAQEHRSVDWIAWWSLGTVTERVIMVWLYNHTGRSVFAMALFHMTGNLAWQLYPVNGSYLDPRMTGIITALVAVVVVLAGGMRSASDRGQGERAGRPGEAVQHSDRPAESTQPH